MTTMSLKPWLTAATLLLAGTGVQASDVFYRDGHQCQRASSGAIVCRDPRDRRSPGYVLGRRHEYGTSGRVFYNRRGDKCQRASSGLIVCRHPRDRHSPGYVMD
jgi:hypothetical protein